MKIYCIYHRDSYVSDFSDDPFASRSAETTVDKNIWTVSRGDHGYCGIRVFYFSSVFDDLL